MASCQLMVGIHDSVSGTGPSVASDSSWPACCLNSLRPGGPKRAVLPHRGFYKALSPGVFAKRFHKALSQSVCTKGFRKAPLPSVFAKRFYKARSARRQFAAASRSRTWPSSLCPCSASSLSLSSGQCSASFSCSRPPPSRAASTHS